MLQLDYGPETYRILYIQQCLLKPTYQCLKRSVFGSCLLFSCLLFFWLLKQTDLILTCLCQATIFDDLNDGLMRAVSAKVSTSTYSPGQILVQMGQVNQNAFYVENGLVEVHFILIHLEFIHVNGTISTFQV